MKQQISRQVQPVSEFGSRPAPAPIAPEILTAANLIGRQAPINQAYQILRAGFTAAPILAGADKFFNRMTDWDQYLAPWVPRLTGLSPRTFMKAVGVIEIGAGIGVAVKPKVFSYVVSAWLGGIIVNLVSTRRYYDIALRDLGLSLAALSLGRLSQSHHQMRRAA